MCMKMNMTTGSCCGDQSQKFFRRYENIQSLQYTTPEEVPRFVKLKKAQGKDTILNKMLKSVKSKAIVGFTNIINAIPRLSKPRTWISFQMNSLNSLEDTRR